MVDWTKVLGETEYPHFKALGHDVVEFVEGTIRFSNLKQRAKKTDALNEVNKMWNMGSKKTRQLAAKALRRRGFIVEFDSNRKSYEVY